MKQYKISNYRLCTFVMKIEIDKGYLLYNTLTDSLVYIEDTDNIEDILQTLIEIKDYVSNEFDEVAMIDEMRLNANRKASKRIDGYTIFTTLDCNARCYYCYEKGTPRISMSEENANDTADYIIRNSNGYPQSIKWFGGEPLVNEKAIDIITEKLNQSKVKFQSRMTSNGLLFNKENISKAQNKWYLKKVQITLDGTKEVYQRAKGFSDAQGNEFEMVLNNIDDLLKSKIQVLIRLNQDLHNTNDLIDLVNFLSKRFENRKGLSMYNCLLFEDVDGASKNNPEERYGAFLKVQNLIIQKGLFSSNAPFKKFKSTHCMADNDSSITINPNGKIGKCEHFPNDYYIGSIYARDFDEEIVNKWKETYPITSKCKVCPIYPQCVRIIMCPESNDVCSLMDCENKIQLIKKAVINRYKNSIQQV